MEIMGTGKVAATFQDALLRLRRASALFTVISLSGCAYLSPFVPLEPTYTKQTTGNMPELSSATLKIDSWLKLTEALRDSTSMTQRSLNLMTFGFGFAAGTSSIYGAHKDTVTGLGLASAASYTGSALFVPADQTTLYNSAMTALICIKTKADTLRSLVDTTEKRRTADLGDNYITNLLRCNSSSTESADRARRAAIGTLNAARDADFSAANRTSNAALGVVHALNHELTQRAPNAQAVLAAAKSAVAMAGGVTSLVSPPGPKPAVACMAAADDQAKALETSYRAAETAITSALNAIGALDTACVLNAPAIPSFNVTQEQITLAVGATYTITLSGGRPPYRKPEWVGQSPANVSVLLAGAQTIVLSAASTAKPGGPYTLTVGDSALIPATKTIAVNIK